MDNHLYSSLHTMSSQQVQQYCTDKHILSLWLTGSFADGHFTQDSDVDLVYTKDDDRFSLMDKYDIQDFLSQVIHKSVDMISLNALREPIRSSILSKYIKIF